MPASYRDQHVPDLIFNQILSRTDWMRRLQDPRRNIDHECGYPEHVVTAQAYQDLVEREAVADRVLKVMPSECWAASPKVYESEDADKVTPFEDGWDGLGKQLRGQYGWHKEEAGSGVWDVLRRADERSRVGRYGGVLFGIDDGRPLDQPADFNPGPTATRKLLYLRVFSEVTARVRRLDPEPGPHYGWPLSYDLTLADPDNFGAVGSAGVTRECHWTRFLHLAECVTEGNGAFAVPVLRPILRRLLDLEKLYAASAEMYFQGALPGWVLKINSKLDGVQVDVDQQSVKDMIEAWKNGLDRFMAVNGGEIQSLAPQVVDPGPHIMAQLQAIAIAMNMPMRKLMGSERGELASTQDESDWDGKVKARREGYCTPRIVVPFVDRCIALGLLPTPGEEGYCVWWPEQSRQTEVEKADILVKRTQALSAYVAGGAEALIPPLDYLTREMGYEEEEAAEILESAEELAAEREAEEAELREEEMRLAAEAQARQGTAGQQTQAGGAAGAGASQAGGNGVARAGGLR